jgi:hypothetical protein
MGISVLETPRGGPHQSVMTGFCGYQLGADISLAQGRWLGLQSWFIGLG